MKLPLEPGDEVVSMVRVEQQLLVITRYGHFFEVWYDGMGQYRVQKL